jgi:hypothetical protein
MGRFTVKWDPAYKDNLFTKYSTKYMKHDKIIGHENIKRELWIHHMEKGIMK